jgi:hypothetical protein
VLTQTPDTATTAVLVVETGAAVRVFGLDRGTSGKFDTDTGEISGP